MPTQIKSGDGELKLLHDMLIQAVRDALSSDPELAQEARAWLSDLGAELAEHLHITEADTVRQWAQDPHLPYSLSTTEVAKQAHVGMTRLRSAIKHNELQAFPSLSSRMRIKWRILPQDANAWRKQIQKGGW